MAMSVLSIDLNANVARYAADMGKAARISEQTGARIAKGLGVIQSVAGGLLAGISIAGLVAGVKEVAAYSDEIGKMSQRVGIATEALSGLAYAAKLSDVSNQQLGAGLQRLSKYLQEAAGGVEQNKRVLKELGVTELRDVNLAFQQLSTRFSEMREGSGKTAAAMEVFGKSGADLLPLLNTGAEGIRAATAEAERFGIIVNRDAVVAAERLNDNMTRLSTLAQGVAISLGSDLVDGLGRTATAYLDAAAAGSKYQGVLEAIKTLFTGDDQHKNNVKLVEQTDELLALEQDISRLRSSGTALDAAQARRKEERLKVLREEIKLTQSYRKVLEDTAVKPIATRDVNTSIFGTGDKKGGAATSRAAAAEPIDSTQRALDSYIASLQSAIERTQDLTELQRAELRIAETGARGFSESKRAYVLDLARQLDATRELTEEQEKAAKAAVEAEKAISDAMSRASVITGQRLADLMLGNDAMIRNNDTLRQQLEDMGLNTDALERQRLARLDDALATERQNLVQAQNDDAGTEAIALIEQRIRLLKTERDLTSKTGDRRRNLEAEAESAEAARTLNRDVKGALSNAFRDSNNAIEAFGDALGNVVYTRLTESTATVLANFLVGTGKKDDPGGVLSDWISGVGKLFSFDGGGYTGAGARAGGLDGKGGFLSVLHPQETVIDHTKGQRRGGGLAFAPVYNITVDSRSDRFMLHQDLQQMLQANNRQLFEELQRREMYN